MIAARLRMQVSQQNRAALLEVLGYIIDRIRGQPGCIECRLSSDLERMRMKSSSKSSGAAGRT